VSLGRETVPLGGETVPLTCEITSLSADIVTHVTEIKDNSQILVLIIKSLIPKL
jgi:hypothetical protein